MANLITEKRAKLQNELDNIAVDEEEINKKVEEYRKSLYEKAAEENKARRIVLESQIAVLDEVLQEVVEVADATNNQVDNQEIVETPTEENKEENYTIPQPEVVNY